MTLRRIGPASTAKVMGVLYALLGFIVGGMFSLAALLGAAIGSATGEGADAIFTLAFGLGAVIVLPIFYGVLGVLAGLIGAALYNLVARLIGGIELELDPS